MTVYLSVADVLAIHEVMIQRYGGGSGIRDLGALESALFRPQTGYYPDVIAESAALFESLVINHPFMDGNKRVGFAATDVFLRLNGVRLNRTSSRIHSEIMEFFQQDTLEFSRIDGWLRSFAVRL